jgi:hypothetical protein
VRRLPRYFDPHPPDILGLKSPGVLEEGIVTLALQLPVHDLAPLIVLPAFRFTVVNRG